MMEASGRKDSESTHSLGLVEESLSVEIGRNRSQILLLAFVLFRWSGALRENCRMPGSHPRDVKADRPRWLQRPLSASGRFDSDGRRKPHEGIFSQI